MQRPTLPTEVEVMMRELISAIKDYPSDVHVDFSREELKDVRNYTHVWALLTKMYFHKHEIKDIVSWLEH